MSAFKRSAVSVGTPDMSPPDVGSSIGPISLHNAIESEVYILLFLLGRIAISELEPEAGEISRRVDAEGDTEVEDGLPLILLARIEESTFVEHDGILGHHVFGVDTGGGWALAAHLVHENQRLRVERDGPVGDVLDAEGHDHEVAAQGVRRERETVDHVGQMRFVQGPGEFVGNHGPVYGPGRRFDECGLLLGLGLRASNARACGRLAKYSSCRERPDNHRGDQRDQPQRACDEPQHRWIYLPSASTRTAKTSEPASAPPLS